MRAVLQDETESLKFENEYQLGTKPKEIDVLVIKENAKHRIQKNVGRIFRRYNIIEYKGPSDKLSSNDYYLIHGYACFYIGDAEKVLEIDPKEVTLTFICNHQPRKLLEHLKDCYGIAAEQVDAGIYYLRGSRFPIQLIINRELDPGENLWLYSLRNDLSKEEIEAVIEDYAKHKDLKDYQSVMDIITRANWERIKGEQKMCDALRELFAEEFAEREQLGEDRMGQLIGVLLEKDRLDDLKRISEDKAYRYEMIQKYGLLHAQ